MHGYAGCWRSSRVMSAAGVVGPIRPRRRPGSRRGDSGSEPGAVEIATRRLRGDVDILCWSRFCGSEPVQLGECLQILRAICPLLRRNDVIEGGDPDDDAPDDRTVRPFAETFEPQMLAVAVGNVGEDVEIAGIGAPGGDLHSLQHGGIEDDGERGGLGVCEALDMKPGLQLAHRRHQSLQVLARALGHTVEVSRWPLGAVDGSGNAPTSRYSTPWWFKTRMIRKTSSSGSSGGWATLPRRVRVRTFRFQLRYPFKHRLPGVEPPPIHGDRDVVGRARSCGAHPRLKLVGIDVNGSSHRGIQAIRTGLLSFATVMGQGRPISATACGDAIPGPAIVVARRCLGPAC